jgi:hypothetical protein
MPVLVNPVMFDRNSGVDLVDAVTGQLADDDVEVVDDGEARRLSTTAQARGARRTPGLSWLQGT